MDLSYRVIGLPLLFFCNFAADISILTFGFNHLVTITCNTNIRHRDYSIGSLDNLSWIIVYSYYTADTVNIPVLSLAAPFTSSLQDRFVRSSWCGSVHVLFIRIKLNCVYTYDAVRIPSIWITCVLKTKQNIVIYVIHVYIR